ncbi:HAMP domain-containing protein [Pseudomonas alkylphenolica]|uniref:methyl-accepting chemotaxis protein n=1 Tax=Pseudomonas alkylphenolica TaxID=237609 RepID=UPI00269BC06A
MFDTLSIRLKIVLLSGLCLLGVVALVVGINLYQSQQSDEQVGTASTAMLTRNVQALLQARAGEKAELLRRRFNENQTLITALADQVSDLQQLARLHALNGGDLREAINQSLATTFKRNPQALGVWLAFEPNALDGGDAEFANDAKRLSNESGRFASYWSRAQGEALNTVISDTDLNKTDINLSGTPYNVWYTCSLNSTRPCLLEPYADTVGGKQMLMTSITVPLMHNGKVIAVAGVDISLDALQFAASKAQQELFDGAGHLMIVSPSGLLAANSDDAAKVGKNVGQTLGQEGQQAVQKLAGNQPLVLEQGETVRAVYPVQPIADSKAWGILIDLPKQVLLADAISLQSTLEQARTSGTLKVVLFATLAGLGGLLLMWLTATGVTRPLNTVADMLEDIASGDGDLTQRLHYARKDELGRLTSGFNRFL